MDEKKLSHEDKESVLHYLDRVNRYFGGHSGILKKIDSWTEKIPVGKPISILDVGTGSGELPLSLVEWGKHSGRPLRIVGLEKSEEWSFVAEKKCGGHPSIEIRTGDVFNFNEQFDFVVSNLVLHHIAPLEQLKFLHRCDELAIRGVMISDLERSWKNLIAVKATTYLWGNWVVRIDGPLSVRRSLTREEALDLTARSGLSYLRARNEPWCRLSIAGVKE